MICKLCELEVFVLTDHHLIPKQKGGSKGEVLEMCEDCHKMIHELHSNYELAKFYYTENLLKESEKIKKYVNWKRKHPDSHLPIAKKKKK